MGDPCVIAAAEVASVDSVHVVLEAAHPGSVSAALDPLLVPRSLFFETLVRVDCAGTTVPGLAAHWTRTSDGATRFTLTGDARFWNGAPVTARDVAAVLATDDRVESITVESENTLEVRHDEDPALFAAPLLAITMAEAGSTRRQGTGVYAIESAAGTMAGVREVFGRARGTGVPPFVRITTGPSVDGRDALDAGADVLVTRDPDVLAYARRLAAFDIAPLPWNRRYLLVTATAGASLAVPAGLRESIAGEVVREDARAATGEEAGEPAEACPVRPHRPSPSPPTGEAVIAYPRDDATAAALAERLAALGASPDNAWLATRLGVRGRDRVRATGLTAPEFAAALRAGSHVAYVLPIPTRAVPNDGNGGCPAQELLERAGWLGERGGVTPLVETRPHLVRRRGVGPVLVDGFGAIRFVPHVGAVR